MNAGRTTRGRLSSLDLMPDEAQDDIAWAMGELNQRKRTQADILFELNDRLDVKGVGIVSKSAFNRKAVRVSMVAARVAESRALFKDIAPQFTPEMVDESNLVIGELIKLLIADILDAGAGELNAKSAMELARGYQATIQGQRLSSDHRRKLQGEFAAKAGAAVDKVATATGLSAETRDRLRAELLGIRKD